METSPKVIDPKCLLCMEGPLALEAVIETVEQPIVALCPEHMALAEEASLEVLAHATIEFVDRAEVNQARRR